MFWASLAQFVLIWFLPLLELLNSAEFASKNVVIALNDDDESVEQIDELSMELASHCSKPLYVIDSSAILYKDGK